jgi:hypothetical protein
MRDLLFRTPFPPADPARIRDLEARCACPLPDDYRQYLLQVGGGGNPRIRHGQLHNQPYGGDGFTLYGVRGLLSGEGSGDDVRWAFGMWWKDVPRRMIPIAWTGTSDPVILDVWSGEVFIVDPHEIIEGEPIQFSFVAKSFTEFLEMLTDTMD